VARLPDLPAGQAGGQARPRRRGPAVVHIVGKSNSGKTLLVVRLVRELRRRGYQVGTIKHASHGFDLDKRGKDSWRHFQAGSEATVVVSPRRLAMVKRTSGEPQMEEALRLAGAGCDLVLVEGYKSYPGLKIEVHRRSLGSGLMTNADGLLAVVSDATPEVAVPVFRPRDVTAVADLLEREVLGTSQRIENG
jgi:molybdopterin-guanine dinucleotide biosynthesis protein B